MQKIFFLLLLPLFLGAQYQYGIKMKHPKKNNTFKRLFTLSDTQLTEMKQRGEQLSRTLLPDLTNFYLVESDIPLENDYLRPKPVVPPGDIDPITPDFTSYQGYLESFDTDYGFNSRYGWNFEGGKGEEITIVDLEYDWQLDHEDLELKDGGILYDLGGKNLTGTPKIRESNPEYKSEQHGAAVLGILSSIHNEYGVSGMSPGATVKVISSFTDEYPIEEPGFSVADAILRAASVLNPGDILLLEAQTTRYGGFGADYIPVEYDILEFSAIRYATSLGIVVIEAAGNGGQNLDLDTLYGERPQVSRNSWVYNEYEAGNSCCYEKDSDRHCIQYGSCDSGAIIVGAGEQLGAVSFSSYGSRVDLQGWGSYTVETLGFGDRFDGSLDDQKDPKQYYTAQFSGTSSASPMIAATAAQLQGRYKAVYNSVLSPIELRAVLKMSQHSNPQEGDITKHIGPQPEIKKIFDSCFKPCGETYCQYYQRCSESRCVTESDFCSDQDDCGTGDTCYLHRCVDICSGVTCGEYMHCEAIEQQGSCSCDTGYYLKGDLCEVIPKPTAAPNPSCDFGGGKSPLFFLFLFVILVLRRRVEKVV